MYAKWPKRTGNLMGSPTTPTCSLSKGYCRIGRIQKLQNRAFWRNKYGRGTHGDPKPELADLAGHYEIPGLLCMLNPKALTLNPKA